MKQLKKYPVYVPVLLILAGLIYQNTATCLDIRRFPPSGQFVDMDGYTLHFKKSGKGRFTVVFDSGMGASHLAWEKVIPEIGKVAGVFAYDRAGLGWSEKSPLPRTSERIVEELHRLLKLSHTPGPYILVGHSFGGLNMQLYAATYPGEVAGLVLIDSSHAAQMENLRTTGFLKGLRHAAVKISAPLGISRMMARGDTAAEQAVMSTVRHQYTRLDEQEGFARSLETLAGLAPHFGTLPLTVISRNSPVEVLRKKGAASERHLKWAGLQQDLAGRSANGFLVFSGEEDHGIHKSSPGLVIEEIKQVVALAEALADR
ncbi:MAG: alpha/beta hydrolase [Desulfobacterales bacterium]|nr:alpha/beta hydrolase [Desulfobacterales bacterium]